MSDDERFAPSGSYEQQHQAGLSAEEEAEMALDPDAEEEEEEPAPRGRYDDDDDEEEDEEEEDDYNDRKRKRQRRSKHDVSTFLDTMAEVSDDDDEEDEGEDIQDGFVTQGIDEDEEPGSRGRHAQLDVRRQVDDDRSAEEIARALKGRYAGHAAVRYSGDMNDIPQRLLMPSVHDASLWQIRVKTGREREIVFSLMRKAIDREFSARPLNILSAFQRDSLPGIVYVEARSSAQVSQACEGLVGVYLSRGVHLVPIDEMASLLLIKKIEQTLQPGSWVRFRRGKYAGDLAQVLDIDDTGENVGLKFVPRIDLTPREEDSEDSRKRKKSMAAGTMRPPQRLFNYDEVSKIYQKRNIAVRGGSYLFQNDTFKDGFMEKDFKVSALITEDVHPTLDEITMFSTKEDGQENTGVNLSAIAEASKKAAVAVLQPGDHIEVFEGEQSGVHGVVDQINQDVVTFTASGSELDGQKIEVPARSVRKRFKPGDHVKVMSGQNANETGLVVAVSENVVTFVSDMSMQEVSVFSKDLREAAEVGSSTNIVGNYELHDLVQLDVQTVGVIFKTERDSFRVLDQNGHVRLVRPHQISMRRDSRKAIATDSHGHEIRIGDNMKEIDGEGRKGHVLHIYQALYAFLHNRDIAENGGIFVTRARSLESVAPKGGLAKSQGMDLSKMNPAAVAPTGGMVGSGMLGRGPRDRLIGVLVTVVKGLNKGLIGTIRDTNGPIARVELHNVNNKLVSVDKAKLRRRLPDGTLQPLDAPVKNFGHSGSMGPPTSFGRSSNPYSSGGNTTPAWNGGSKTPAWNMGRTPNPYASGDGGRTPAWNTSSKTPNPYADSSRTPAWNASSKTPNPYGGNTQYGGATSYGGGTSYDRGGAPGWGNSRDFGGATPGRPSNTDWGTTSNTNWSSEENEWGSTSYDSAPTPAAAPTPGVASASTPWASATPAASNPYSAPTPGLAASTPWSAPTPGADLGNDEDGNEWGDEPPVDWVYQLKDSVQSQVKVRIAHPREDRYLDNKYLDAVGHVATANKLRPEPSDTDTVTVRFDQVYGDEVDVGPGRSILAKYVRPIEPTEVGQRVAVLHGLHKNQVLRVKDVQDLEDGSVNVLFEDTGVIDTIKVNKLAIVE